MTVTPGLVVVQDAPPGADYHVGVEQGVPYAITGPDGTRAVFNDRDDPDFVGFLTAPPAGLDSPEVRESSDLVVEGDGGVHGLFYFGRRPFQFDGIIDPTARVAFEEYDETALLVGTNLIPNPNAAVNATGFGASTTPNTAAVAAAVTRQAVTAMGEGGFAYRLTGTNAADATPRQFVAASTPGIAITAGQAYTLSILGRAADPPAVTASGYIFGRLDWYTAASAYIGSLYTSAVNPAAGVDFELDIAGAIAPPTAYYAIVALGVITNTPSDTIDVNFKGVTLSEGSTPRRFTGDTYPGGYPQRTAWTGTANASPSALYDVTRAPWEAGKTMARRAGRLQRATRALRGDLRVEWPPSAAPPVRIIARRAAPLRIGGRLPKTFTVPLVAADPRIYGQALRGVSGPTGAGQLSVVNDGNAAAPPTVTVRATGTLNTPIVITNHATGEDVRLALTLTAGQVLVVDFAAKTVTVNGANRYDAVDFTLTEWWEVQPGTQAVSVAVGGSSGAGTWDIAWRDAWV